YRDLASPVEAMEAGGPGEEAAKAQADAIRERGEETEDRLEDAAGGMDAAPQQGRAVSAAPLPPLFRRAQHLVSNAVGVERLGRRLIVGLDVGVDFLGLGPPGLAHRLEIGIGLEPEHFERAHLVGATAAVARTCPAVVRGRGIPGIGPLLGTGPCFGLGFFEPLEVVPLGVVLGRVPLAEVPPLATVGGLGCRAVARLVAAVPVAQPHLGRLARAAVAAPAREAPVERARWARHQVKSSVSIASL